MAKGTSVKGVAALGLVCDVNAQRYTNNIKWVLPMAEIENSPTNVWLKQNRDAMLSLEAALKSTQYKLAQLRIHKRDGDKDKFKRELGLDGEEEEEEEYQEEGEEVEDLDDLTPEVPILTMNLDDVSKYFSKLMRRLQEMQYGELDKNFRFWASRRNPEAEPGTNFVDNLLSLLSI